MKTVRWEPLAVPLHIIETRTRIKKNANCKIVCIHSLGGSRWRARGNCNWYRGGKDEIWWWKQLVTFQILKRSTMIFSGFKSSSVYQTPPKLCLFFFFINSYMRILTTASRFVEGLFTLSSLQLLLFNTWTKKGLPE